MRSVTVSKMADSLRRLVNTSAFSLLQEKLERWNSNYLINTCDQNVSACCELIELHSRLQGQLFNLLNLCSAEGGMYGGAEILKNRLLPWLGQGFLATAGSVSTDTSLHIMAEAADKERQIAQLQDQYETQLDDLERDLNKSRTEADLLKKELEDTKDELSNTQRSATSEAIISDEELSRLKQRLAETEDELRLYKSKSGMIDDLELELRRLREDIQVLRQEKAILTGRLDDALSYVPSPRSSLKPLSTSNDVVQRIRQANLLTRFSDMFAHDRMDAMDTLRNHCDDHEMNQRIVFAAVQESFHAAKIAFRQYKSKVRATLSTTHVGPETLEEGVQNYINKNGQLLDVHTIVQDVLRALNRHPTISFPPEVDFRVLTLFIRECVKVAWSMSALPSPLDIALASDAEVYDESKYRRSYDSEYTAPLISHFIWPSLLDYTGKVLLKGEAVTRRGASLSPRRSRSPTRSSSPIRSRSRSRSASPRRLVTPSMNGSLSPGRASSPVSSRVSFGGTPRATSPRPTSVASNYSGY
ncbi:mitochondria-eating protein-like [Ptychodera flava]|uniref:mitochondria-eating protein-like n=1 Tax=Ptychodera flava TaxID=63121 RepID=UPI00396A8ECC